MSDLERKYTKKTSASVKKPSVKSKAKIKLPPQNGPRDTSNWENKVYKAPDGKRIIETEQVKKEINIAE